MSGIVKVNSTDADSIKNDIIAFLESGGSPLDLNSYFAGSENAQLVNLITGIWIQLNEKAENIKKDAFLLSTGDIGSIKYNAMSLLGYSPKQNTPSMHSKNSDDYFGFCFGPHFADAGEDSIYQIVGSIKVDNQNYNISLYKKINTQPGFDACFKCALGEWKKKTIDQYSISSASLISSKFKMISFSEDKDIIDMDSLKVSLSISNQELKVVKSLKDIATLSSSDKARAVVAMPSYFGGINLLFGDGQIYGSDYAYAFSDSNLSISIDVRYFVSAGFVSGLDFSEVAWDENLIHPEDAGHQIYFAPLAAGQNAENPSSIRFRAIQEFTSANKICNADDLMNYLRSLPLIKSCWSYKGVPGDVNEWIPYAFENDRESGVYSRGVVVNSAGKNYVCLTNNLKSDVSPANDTTNWMEVSNVVWQDNATLILYALVGRGIPHFNPIKEYRLGEVVISETKYWKAAKDISVGLDDDNVAIPNEAPSDDNDDWEETDPNYWTSMTQAQWELEYANGLSINSKLGFLSVRVRPCTPIIKNYNIKVVRDMAAPTNDVELATQIEKILSEDWFELGRFFSVGRIVNACNNLPGVGKFYLTGDSNKKLDNGEYYVKGDVSIEFFSDDDVVFKY